MSSGLSSICSILVDSSTTLVSDGSTKQLNWRYSLVHRFDATAILCFSHPLRGCWKRSENKETASTKAGACNLSHYIHRRISICLHFPVKYRRAESFSSQHDLFIFLSHSIFVVDIRRIGWWPFWFIIQYTFNLFKNILR